MDVHRAIGRNVQRLRREQGMDPETFIAALADAGLEVSVTTLSRLENGHRGIKVDDLLALAYTLGTSPLALVLPPEDDVLEMPDASWEEAPGLHGVPRALVRDWWVHEDHPRFEVTPEALSLQDVPESAARLKELKELHELRLIVSRLRLIDEPEEGNET